MAVLIVNRLRPRRILAVVFLAAGIGLLVSFWQSLNYLALNRGLGYPAWVSRAEITVWHAIPGFQADLLVGLLPFILKREVGRRLWGLNLVVWTLCLLNLGVILAVATAIP